MGHKDHLKMMDPSRPWMWHVVIGDLLAIVQSMCVSGVGGVQWSMPKLYDDLTWRYDNFPILVSRSIKVFMQIAESNGYTVVDTAVNENSDHEARFQAAKGTLKGYV